MDRKYVVKRGEVKSGTLTKIDDIKFTLLNKDLEISNSPQIIFSNRTLYRGCLFKMGDYNLSEDLIYTAPKYQVEGEKVSINYNDPSFAIIDTANLEELLKYLKFGADLTQEDLNKIYRMLLKHEWWLKRNMWLFGLVNENGIIYHDKSKEILPVEIYDSLFQASFIGGKLNPFERDYKNIRRIS